MTPEEIRNRQDEWLASRPRWGDQDESGDDVSLIEQSLRLTMTERFERYQKDARLALELHHAGKRAGLHDVL